MSALLEIERLCVEYAVHGRRHRAVDGVSLRVRDGESVGIVGESGCGKSSIARAVLGLEVPVAGAIRFRGRSLAAFDRAAWRAYRREVQLVFQDALGALNPRMTVGATLDEVLRRRAPAEQRGAAARTARIRALLELVELSARLTQRFPHELSGGQRQRVALARALAVQPVLLLADEPVSALDVAVQAQLIRLLHRLVAEQSIALVMIAHDLAVIRALCPTVHVLHAGRIVESGAAEELFRQPREDYTRRLLDAVPDVARGLAARTVRPAHGEALLP